MTQRTYPSPEEIERARLKCGFTQEQAAYVVYKPAGPVGRQAWWNWESGKYKMDPAIWELFLLRTGQARLTRVKTNEPV